ncbi:hypothetical protein pipiens_004703 [Culex pipiens pipiens]|uniref:Uncharacterized protein n=1 Tax=Culex pipiens pipiens TaxID=38569 RepID=A0ABD1CFY9_CULPP
MRKTSLPFSPAAQASTPKKSPFVGQPCGNFRLASWPGSAAKSITEFNIAGGDSALLVRSANLLHPVRRHDERASIWNGTAFLSVDGTISGGRYSLPIVNTQVAVLLWCPGRQDPHLRSRPQEGPTRGLPAPIDSKPECQPIMSMCSSDRFRQQALRRAKFKFPSRRKVFIWKKWGFTKYDRDQHQVYWDEVYLVSDGCGVKFFNDHGPLKNREAYERARLAKVRRSSLS